MPLRDFDQVRERIQLRVEVRHIVQGVVALAVLVGGAFAGGIWYARQQPAAPVASPEPGGTPQPQGLPPAAVALAELATRAAETPIYPKPVVLAAAPDALAVVDPEAMAAAPAPPVADAQVAEPTAEQLGTAPGERTIPTSEGTAASTVDEIPVAEPVAAAKPPEPPPAPVVAVKAPAAVVKAPAPAVAVKPAAPVVAVKPPEPHALALFGTLRMAPTVALVSATPAKPALVAAVEPKPHVEAARKPVVRPREDDVRPTPVTGHYVIQIKAFFNEQEAKAFETALRTKGYAPKLTSMEDPGKRMIYRVRLGPYDRPETARAAQKQFEAAEGHVTILLGVP